MWTVDNEQHVPFPRLHSPDCVDSPLNINYGFTQPLKKVNFTNKKSFMKPSQDSPTCHVTHSCGWPPTSVSKYDNPVTFREFSTQEGADCHRSATVFLWLFIYKYPYLFSPGTRSLIAILFGVIWYNKCLDDTFHSKSRPRHPGGCNDSRWPDIAET